MFANIEGQKKHLEELRDLDLLEEERTLCDEEKLGKVKIISDLERFALMEEMS